MKFNIVHLLTLVVGVAVGLELYRVTRESNKPPAPVCSVGDFIEFNSFGRGKYLWEVQTICLNGSKDLGWWYQYRLDIRTSENGTGHNDLPGDFVEQFGVVFPRDVGKNRYDKQLQDFIKEEKEREILRKANKVGDSVAASPLRQRNPQDLATNYS